MNIKEKAKMYKKQNGDKDATAKDLLWYLVGKQDDIEKRMTSVEHRIVSINTTHRNMYKFIVIFIPTCVAGIVTLVHYFLG